MQKSLEKYIDDPICIWMAQYIANKMTAINSVGSEDEALVKRECFETILLFWEYRVCFPDGMRPFESLEPIFHALEHIDPNKTSPSFFRNKNQDKQPPSEIKLAIEFITNLDAAARIMVSFYLRESILLATDKSTLDWLGAISELAGSDESRILLKLVPELDGKCSDQKKNESRKKEISEHIARLGAFESISREIKSVLEAELGELDQE